MISVTHQTYYHYFCKGKVRAQEMISATHQTYDHHFCKRKVRTQEMISATVTPPQGRRRTPRDKDGPRLEIFGLKERLRKNCDFL